MWRPLCSGTMWVGHWSVKKIAGTGYLEIHMLHNSDVIISTIASQITSLVIVYSTVYSDQRKHQSSSSLAFVWGIHRGPVNSPHKWPVTLKMFPFDDVIMRKNYCFDYDLNSDGIGSWQQVNFGLGNCSRPLLLTRIDFNPSKVWGEMFYPFPTMQAFTFGNG